MQRSSCDDKVVLKVFTVIDLDRTLLKSTALFYQYIIPAIQQLYGYSDEVIAEVRAGEQANRGKAFDFIAFSATLAHQQSLPVVDVRELATFILGNQRDEAGDVRDEFVDAIFADDALSLLELLSQRPHEQWGIMTSGGPQTQGLKLLIVSAVIKEKLTLLTNAQVIATEYKAQTIMSEWFLRERDLFTVPKILAGKAGVEARQVRLLDDKAINVAIPPAYSQLAVGLLETFLVQTAEKPERDGLLLAEVIAKIQQ